MKRVVLSLALAAVTAGGGAARGATSPSSSEETPQPSRKSKSKSKAAPKATGAPSLPPEKIETLRLALVGPDDTAAIEAAATLGSSGTAAAVEPLLEVLAAGAAPARLQAALDALGKLGDARVLRADQTTLDALTLYAGHRSPDVRRRAVKVLGSVDDPRATATLLERLGDAASDVRAAAAQALAARHESKAARRMFALLAMGDAGVAGPIAQLATPDMVPRIAELSGTIDDGVVADALGDYVKRADVPDKLRIDVLRTIGGLQGAVATTALVDYVASVPAKDDRPSKREAQKLLDQRGSQ
ncbi:MAG TPA: HEAT repeat domain-containing protein [Polyangia bacterium]|nr:HEAT repeat domain-containing protein [Polyangia bacterium]